MVTDLDRDLDVAVVMGKGRHPRSVPFSPRTGTAIDRYLRARRHHPRAWVPQLWLGDRGKGPMTSDGVYRILRRRGAAVGLPDLHPHQVRHTFANDWFSEEGDEGDLMRLAGGRSRQMLTRYGASAADARAREAHRRGLERFVRDGGW